MNTRGFEGMREWEFPDKTVQYQHPAMLNESDGKRIDFSSSLEHVRKSYFSFHSSGYQFLVTPIKLNYHPTPSPAPQFRTLGVAYTGGWGR